ncbi:hypothetical protein KEM56_007850 [Ascosphaera pollenicola]|nr:hypothetical protein KEM56_007850 [Ascosphaera pollenicola]
MSASQDLFASTLTRNATWASSTQQTDPNLFPSLSHAQSPKVLFLGCSDSRVPEAAILNLKPGEAFVSRNVGNIMTHHDLSLNSVVEYAVVHLGVELIILCGHTNCGACNATLQNGSNGTLLDTWLSPLRRVREDNSEELHELADRAPTPELGKAAMATRLAELNVLTGLRILRENQHVLRKTKTGKLSVRGAVYDVATGLMREVGKGQEDESKELRRRETFELS